MNYFLYILLIPTALVLGLKDLAISCQDNNCSSTETDATSADESIELYSLDLRELHLDECTNLTILEFTPNLRTLEISKCFFWYSSDMTKLSAVGNLSSLHFRNGNLLRLDRNMFAQLPHLEILGLGGNKIATVSADAFLELTQLWMLALNDNRIVYFEERTFRPLVELRHLDVSGNVLLKLPDAIFDNNPKLQVLLLNGNHMSNLNPYTLASLKNLTLLDLSNNYMDEFQLLKAETVILDNSWVYRMDVGNVSKFQARNNYLEYLYFREQIFVTELDLHGNKLRTQAMSNLLKGMWRLQCLDLSANSAKELPALEPSVFDANEVFLLPSLRIVNISRNLLEHLNGDSPLLSPSLTHLDVSYNRICEVNPSIFSIVNSLQSLHMEGNRLDRFSYDLLHNQQQGLQEVALFDNQFSFDRYKQIIHYFKDAGVQVIEQAHSEELSPVKEESSKDKCVRPKINDEFVDHISHSEELSEHQQVKTFKKWSSWKIFIFLCLLASLGSNVVLVIQLRRSREGFEDNSNLL